MAKDILITTVTFNRIEMTKKCLESLFSTADPALYSLMIVDNGSKDGTVDYLKTLTNPQIEDIIFNPENVGTASALNVGWKLAYDRNWHAGKLDNDVVFYDNGWLRKMKYTLEIVGDIGLVGLKRRDLEEKPNHNSTFYRSTLFPLPNNKVVEIAEHVMGTCWLVGKNALQKLGGLKQIGPYGLDDAIYCHRMHIAGYYVAFIPDVAIEHIDPGDSLYPEYTQWKIKQASEVFNSGDYDELMAAYKQGLRSIKEPFE